MKRSQIHSHRIVRKVFKSWISPSVYEAHDITLQRGHSRILNLLVNTVLDLSTKHSMILVNCSMKLR